MNKVLLLGRLTKDPEVRYAQGSNTAIARFTLAVDRKFKKEGEPSADFLNCVAFGKLAEFSEKYLVKGTKIVAEGRIQTGSYNNKDGQKVYTTDIMVESMEFAESKEKPIEGGPSTGKTSKDINDFLTVPDTIEAELPFGV